MNECSACKQDFAGVSGFDAHRRGEYPQTGPSDYLDRFRLNLVPRDEDYRPEFGRRCTTPDELRAAGWRQDGFGRWRQPVPPEDAARLASLRNREPRRRPPRG